ncbi:hypothetical protein Dimus_013583 [Dionaea muscipula]
MRLILRLKQNLATGFCLKSQISSAMELKPFIPHWVLSRRYAPTARKEDEEETEEEVKFDPRKLPADYDPANFDPTSHRSPPTDRVFRLVDDVASLTLMEVAELSHVLMKKMGMSEPPVVGVMKPGAAAGLAGLAAKAPALDAQGEKKQEKTVFDLKLESFDAASKIKVIKEIRTFTELGLKEAKEMVEKAPAVFKKAVPKEEAEQVIEKMKAVGANVVME